MKAVRVEKFGGLEALKIVDIPLADPGEGEARLKIEVIGVNFLDIYQRIGRYQGSLPFTLGKQYFIQVKSNTGAKTPWRVTLFETQ